MPEVYIHFKWPDGQADQVYSPSTVIRNYFSAGEQLSLEQFRQRVNDGLKEAGKRVQEKFGFECTSAAAEISRLNAKIAVLHEPLVAISILKVEARSAAGY